MRKMEKTTDTRVEERKIKRKETRQKIINTRFEIIRTRGVFTGKKSPLQYILAGGKRKNKYIRA